MNPRRKLERRRPTTRDVVAVAARRRWGHSVAEAEVRHESWAWLALAFAVGAPLSTTPVVVGAADARRAVVRLAGLAAVIGGVWVTLLAPASTGWAWGSWLTAAVVGDMCGYRWAEWVRTWRHRRRWVRPLDTALRGQLDYPSNLPARCWLRVPPDLADDEDGVRILLPADFIGRPKQRDHLELTVRSKLGLGDAVTVTWRLTSRRHEVVFRAKARPPAKAMFRDDKVRQLIERARESRPVLGLAAGDRVVAVDLDSESPHIAISAGTGAGKSNLIRLIVAQLMHRGASAVICDLKRRSHRWAKGLDGVTYCREIAEIHDALIALADEAMARNIAADNYPDDAEPPWQRRVLVLEELNSTMDELTVYWRDELGGRGTSPAVRAYRQILFMGRQVKVNIITAAQLLTAQTAGGPAARAQYGTIVMSRFNVRAWKMLLPEITPIPKSGRHVGRGWVALGGEADETQLVFITEAETREWAASGRPSTVRPGPTSQTSHTPGDTGAQGEPAANVATRPVLTVVTDPDDPEPVDGLVTLRQASLDEGEALVGLRYAALRKAAEPGKDFPPPARKVGKTRYYRPDDLARWAANRERPVRSTR
jgi:hypothetical protein